MKKTNNQKNYLSREEYIKELSLRTNEIHMSTKNKKTGPAILDFAFPLCTCREDAPCKETCYANKGAQKICVVQAAYYRNFRLLNDNVEDVFEQIIYKIKHSGLSTVRYFDSGDFPNYEFLLGLIDIANKLPDVKFMAFTKKYELVNRYLTEGNKIPDNFNIIFSAWDKLWHEERFDNPFSLPVAFVDFKDKRFNPQIPENAFRCPSNGKKLGEITCSMCKACWNKKLKNVVFAQH